MNAMDPAFRLSDAAAIVAAAEPVSTRELPEYRADRMPEWQQLFDSVRNRLHGLGCGQFNDVTDARTAPMQLLQLRADVSSCCDVMDTLFAALLCGEALEARLP